VGNEEACGLSLRKSKQVCGRPSNLGWRLGERVRCASAVTNRSNNKDLQVSFVSMASQLCLLMHAIAELNVVCILCMCRIGLFPGWEFQFPDLCARRAR
jgi:hypothetical protein